APEAGPSPPPPTPPEAGDDRRGGQKASRVPPRPCPANRPGRLSRPVVCPGNRARRAQSRTYRDRPHAIKRYCDCHGGLSTVLAPSVCGFSRAGGPMKCGGMPASSPLFFVFGLDDFSSAVVAARTDVVAKVHFAGGRLQRKGGI